MPSSALTFHDEDRSVRCFYSEVLPAAAHKHTATWDMSRPQPTCTHSPHTNSPGNPDIIGCGGPRLQPAAP